MSCVEISDLYEGLFTSLQRLQIQESIDVLNKVDMESTTTF
jgi:hypothetical protein